MSPSILALISLIVEHAPAITAAAVEEYATIAHGEGGLGKVAAAVQGLSNILNAALVNKITPAKPAA